MPSGHLSECEVPGPGPRAEPSQVTSSRLGGGRLLGPVPPIGDRGGVVGQRLDGRHGAGEAQARPDPFGDVGDHCGSVHAGPDDNLATQLVAVIDAVDDEPPLLHVGDTSQHR